MPEKRDQDLDEALPPLPPLDGEDEALGDEGAVPDFDEGASTLDDASASELVVDVEFDESPGDVDESEAPMDLGADDDGLMVDEGAGATDDSALDDRSVPNDLDVPELVEDRGDRGDEGPLGEVMELGALPPLDDEDEDAPPAAPPPRAPVATATRIDVDGVVTAVVDGRRLLLLAGDLFAVHVDPPRLDDILRVEAPDATGCALAVGPRGVLYLATIEGAVLRRGDSGTWRRSVDPAVSVRALLSDGARVWARGRDGVLLRAGEGAGFARVLEVPRAGAWGTDGAGCVAVVDASERGVLRVTQDGAAWRGVELPRGVIAARVAVRGEALAVLDATAAVVWFSLDAGASWSRVPAPGCRAVALIGTDDGRASLLVASLDDRAGRAAVSRYDCDGDPGAPVVLADLRRAGAERDDAVELLAIGRGGARCALVLDGAAYLVEVSAGTRLRS